MFFMICVLNILLKDVHCTACRMQAFVVISILLINAQLRQMYTAIGMVVATAYFNYSL